MPSHNILHNYTDCDARYHALDLDILGPDASRPHQNAANLLCVFLVSQKEDIIRHKLCSRLPEAAIKHEVGSPRTMGAIPKRFLNKVVWETGEVSQMSPRPRARGRPASHRCGRSPAGCRCACLGCVPGGFTWVRAGGIHPDSVELGPNSAEIGPSLAGSGPTFTQTRQCGGQHWHHIPGQHLPNSGQVRSKSSNI